MIIIALTLQGYWLDARCRNAAVIKYYQFPAAEQYKLVCYSSI